MKVRYKNSQRMFDVIQRCDPGDCKFVEFQTDDGRKIIIQPGDWLVCSDGGYFSRVLAEHFDETFCAE